MLCYISTTLKLFIVISNPTMFWSGLWMKQRLSMSNCLIMEYLVLQRHKEYLVRAAHLVFRPQKLDMVVHTMKRYLLALCHLSKYRMSQTSTHV